MNMEDLHEKNKPTNPDLWDQAVSKAKSKFDVYPSAYANAWASKWYKEQGGDWRSTKEESVYYTEIQETVEKMTGEIADKIKGEMKKRLNNPNATVKDFAKSAKESVELQEQKFSKAQIDRMRKEYSSLGTIDPSQPTYKRLTELLDNMSDEQLKQLAQAKIKFVSSLALNRVNKRKMKNESVETDGTFLEEGLRSAFKGGTKEINQFQAKLKELGMAKTYLTLVKNLRGKDSGYGIFAKEEDRGEEYASRTGLGPSFSLSIEKVKGEKLGVEDVQKRGGTTYKRTLIVMKESVELNENKFREVLNRGKKLGDWNMMSYFLYQGNVWMLQSGRAVNQGTLEDFRKRSQPGLLKSIGLTEALADRQVIRQKKLPSLEKKTTNIALVLPNTPEMQTKIDRVLEFSATTRNKMNKLVTNRENRGKDLVLYFRSAQSRKKFQQMLNAKSDWTATESVEQVDEKIKYDPKAWYLLLKGKVYGPYRNSDKALYDSDGEGEVKIGSELTPKERKKLTESVELDEAAKDHEYSDIEEVFGGIKRYIKSANKDISKWDPKDRIAHQQLQNKKGPESRPLGAGFVRRAKAAKLKKQRRETRVEDWQKVNRKDNVDGLSQKAVDAYRRENPGSKLQTAVTEKNPKGKRAARRASFCSRMSGMKDKLTSSETANDPDSRINKALRRWNC